MKVAIVRQLSQAATHIVHNLHLKGAKFDPLSLCPFADFRFEKMLTVSGFSYRVQLVENFHQVLLQLYSHLFALRRQAEKYTSALA